MDKKRLREREKKRRKWNFFYCSYMYGCLGVLDTTGVHGGWCQHQGRPAKKKKEKTSDAQRIPNDPMGIVTHRSFLLLLLPPYFHGIKLRDGTFLYQHRMLLPQPMYVIRLPLGMLLTTGQHLTLSVLLFVLERIRDARECGVTNA